MAKPSSAPQPARAYKATLGNLGRVIRGAEITEGEAVAERKAGRSIVVCGSDGRENRELAQRIENAVGPNFRQDPHRSAGPYALPHFQQDTPPPEGHAFYETAGRKAARNP
jgi:hypothetical protein